MDAGLSSKLFFRLEVQAFDFSCALPQCSDTNQSVICIISVCKYKSVLSISFIFSSETVYECPDYRTAGENSCFFNKNDTSLWVNYNITVVATNALGKNTSDPVEVDVVYIGMLTYVH